MALSINEKCKAIEALPNERLHLAYHLLRYTGQRRSDIVQMTWANFEGNAIQLVQEKIGTYVWVPTHPILRAVLERTERSGLYILMSERGAPFRACSVTNMVCNTCADLGYPGYSPHGLRHLAGAELAEAGASMNEIMSILGHLTESEAANYVQQAQRKVMARSAMNKWGGTA